MGALPRATRVGTVVLVAATAIAFIVAARAWDGSLNRDDVIVAFILGAMIVLAEVFDISFPHSAGTFHVSVGSPIALAAGFQLGPFVGGVVVGAAILCESIYARRAPIRTAVNVANLGLATLLGAAVYHGIAGPGTPLNSLRNMAAAAIASLVWILINSSALAAIVAPIVGTSPLRMLRTNLSGIYVLMLTLPTFGAIVPVLANENPLALLVLVVPLVGPLLAFRGFEKAGQETRETMEGLADVLERRDPYTHHHSIRVTEYVEAILKELPPVPFETAQSILAAARVHDLGKVVIRDGTLNKQGPLTPEERDEVAGHPVIGAEIVQRLWIYRPCVDVIRHHHERFDGRGYPDGLAGHAIPLGARVIAVADAFDAMTSDRPYRRALDRETALEELRAKAGSQFDPEIVAAFHRALLGPQATEAAATLSPTPTRPVPAVPAS
jgi:HD-GYP domain-containing protein (c-di-GMP phosphodiesterase class II)